MTSIETKDLKGLFQSVSEVMNREKDKLAELDSELGDGDLGLTMSRGFSSMPGIIQEVSEEDIGKTIMKAGMRLASVVPSTMGFLMSSGFMSAGKALGGHKRMDSGNYAHFLRAFAEGIIKRGKCSPGDRTILDTMETAAREAERLSKETEINDFETLALEVEKAAWQGVESTKTMEPKFGKAAVHKQKAIGKPDQGALAGFYLIRGITNYILER